MKNKKGFTLIELLAIIVVLGVILIIVIPKVNDIIREKKANLYSTSKKEIEKAAKEYMALHPEAMEDGAFYLDLSVLCNADYLDCPLYDPRTKTEMSGLIYINEDMEYSYGGHTSTEFSALDNTSIDDSVAIKTLTISGKSKQINTTQGKNLLDDDSWYPIINTGNLYTQKPAKLTLDNNYKYPSIFTNLKPGTYTLSSDNAYSFSVNRLSINGVAATNPGVRPFPYTFTITTECLVGISVERNTSNINNTDIAVGANTSPSTFKFQIELGSSATAYQEFIPTTPSPEYPSTIDSIGTYNEVTNKYDVTIVNGEANLYTNGYGELDNNTNFSSWTYVNNAVIDAKNSFKRTIGNWSELTNSDFIPVDTSKGYTLSLDMKNNGLSTDKYYAGFISYDVDKLKISPSHTSYVTNTLTYLTQDLKNRDTVVHLNSVANFEHVASTPNYKLGLIFWNYKDSTGYQYPELTYSRNVWSSLYAYTDVDTTNNTITLSSEWNHGTFPAGTKVSQTNSGGYNYGAISNGTLTKDWQTKSFHIQGITNSYLPYTKFPYGTKYIKFMAYNNYGGVSNVVTYYRNIVLREDNLPSYTYSLEAPLRSLPDGTSDKLVIDNINRRAYVERNIGLYTFTGNEDWSGPARNGTYKTWSMQSQAINGFNNTENKIIAISNVLKPIGYYTLISSMTSSVSLHKNGLGSVIFTLSDYDTGLTSSSTASGINTAFKAMINRLDTAGTPVIVQYKRSTPGIEELPYQAIQPNNGTINLNIAGYVQPDIAIDYIK